MKCRVHKHEIDYGQINLKTAVIQKIQLPCHIESVPRQVDAQTQDYRARLCLNNEKPATMEKLQAKTQQQPAVFPSRISRPLSQELVTEFL
jgi:hypothetical protein